jgi:hypothetical protein
MVTADSLCRVDGRAQVRGTPQRAGESRSVDARGGMRRQGGNANSGHLVAIRIWDCIPRHCQDAH